MTELLIVSTHIYGIVKIYESRIQDKVSEMLLDYLRRNKMISIIFLHLARKIYMPSLL